MQASKKGKNAESTGIIAASLPAYSHLLHKHNQLKGMLWGRNMGKR
jgi:hypothetical protein